MGGLYRGVVQGVHGLDLEVSIPAVHGAATLLAKPCVPPGSTATPAVGSGVWLMFEHGDPAHPVWMGTWMGG